MGSAEASTAERSPATPVAPPRAPSNAPERTSHWGRRFKTGAWVTVFGLVAAGGGYVDHTFFGSKEQSPTIPTIETVLGQRGFDIYTPGKKAPKPTSTQIEIRQSSTSPTGFIAVAASSELAPCFTEEVEAPLSRSSNDPTYLREPEGTVNPLTGHLVAGVAPSQEPAFMTGQQYDNYVQGQLAAMHGKCDA